MGMGFHILAFSSALQFCKESKNSHKVRSMNVGLWRLICPNLSSDFTRLKMNFQVLLFLEYCDYNLPVRESPS